MFLSLPLPLDLCTYCHPFKVLPGPPQMQISPPYSQIFRNFSKIRHVLLRTWKNEIYSFPRLSVLWSYCHPFEIMNRRLKMQISPPYDDSPIFWNFSKMQYVSPAIWKMQILFKTFGDIWISGGLFSISNGWHKIWVAHGPTGEFWFFRSTSKPSKLLENHKKWSDVLEDLIFFSKHHGSLQGMAMNQSVQGSKREFRFSKFKWKHGKFVVNFKSHGKGLKM